MKIGARELPAVTQLFTEDYMVQFLLDNALGAWWAARRLSADDLKHAQNEEELRQKAAINGVELEYLRFVQGDDGAWSPASGTFDAWPEHLADLKTMDPSCGSGHFMVAGLLMLVPMRVELEGLSVEAAVDAVLSDNIHGLELDQRCVELAAFALALTAWKYPDAGGYRILPELSVACSGLSVGVAKEEWKELGLGKRNLTIALDWMHDTFKDAPVLGSLINPAKSDAAKLVQWEELSSALDQALNQEQSSEQQEVAVVAHGLAKAATLLARQYQWVITNVPYLTRGKQNECLRDFCESNYPVAKNDLATVFLDRCLELCVKGGTSSIVVPQNWLFLTSYKKFREKLLTNDTWHLIARLGSGAFETITGEVVKAILITLSHGNSTIQGGGLFGKTNESNQIRGVDVSELRSTIEKAADLGTSEITSVHQVNQLENPDARVVFNEGNHKAFLGDHCTCIEGISTGDIPRYVMFFWEINTQDYKWVPLIQNVTQTTFYAGCSEFILWENNEGTLRNSPTAHNFPSENMNGYKVLGNRGIRITQMGRLPVTIYTGEVFGKNGGTLIPRKDENLSAVWSFCESTGYAELVREIDQSMAVTVGSMIKIPFDLEYWTKVANEKYPNGLPKPFSDDPTQWIFHGHPCRSVVWDKTAKWTANGRLRSDDSVLQVAVTRLLGYQWPAELDPDMELADEQRDWVTKAQKLNKFADEDGIVCIPSVRREVGAADRLLKLLVASYGESWSNQVLSDLLKSSGAQGRTLETYLREYFFTQHCKLFKHRPFIWQIWDGLSDGFSVLVNYHKLDHKLLETLIYDYLGDWISRQQRDKDHLVDGSEEKLAAAKLLKQRLELILEGEQPYDVFVRWKALEDQPIGWEPDFNDGVRLNIRPFMTVPDIKKKGAGVLRDKPNVHWKKDRGKDVVSAPWYNLGPQSGGKEGDRINDHHLSLAEKQATLEKN